MGLRSKLFSVFVGIILCLLGFTLYFSHTRTRGFEIERITQQLRLTETRFRQRFENERAFNRKLLATITSDQKYRSFLQQIRDNFYSFAEEIALDSGADLVIITDEDHALRGLNPPPNGVPMAQFQTRASEMLKTPVLKGLLGGILETGKPVSRVLVLAGRLINSVHMPLKESVKDDYALGVVSAGVTIDDAWVTALLGRDKQTVEVVFFAGDGPVAANVGPARGRAILKAAATRADRINMDVEAYRLDGENHLLIRGAFADAGGPAGFVFTASLDAAMAPFVALQWKIFMIGLGALAVGLVVVLVLTNRIVFPVRLLVKGTSEVMGGNYDYKVENKSKDEVGQLARAFNHMVDGLKEKEQIRNLFGKYVHPAIIGDIMKDPENLQLGGTRRMQSLLFSDIEGFTTISEGLDAEQLVAFLNEYLGAMSAEISSGDGILDKYLGDGIMAFWGPPFSEDNFALKAVITALGMQGRLAELRPGWQARGLPAINMRVGVATGEVIVGNIGSEQAQDYTCIGDTVNLASRLEGVNKHYRTRILIDDETRRLAGDAIVVRELDTVQVKGREEGTPIFEVLGMAGDAAAAATLLDGYAVALAQYRQGDFTAAARAFDGLTGEFDDGASRVMAMRAQTFVANPPVDWTGIYSLLEK